MTEVFEGILGQSRQLQKIRQQAIKLADSHLGILIEGEEGTGKGSLAAWIHQKSVENRRESRGFLTGWGGFSGGLTEALKQVENPEGQPYGTFFLEGVEGIGQEEQRQLLHFLRRREEKKIQSPRIIASTCGALDQLTEAGLFSRELHDRLKEAYLYLPPLRERQGDIPLLTAHFVSAMTEGEGISLSVDEAVSHFFLEYGWPGNVRQLRSTVQFMMVLRQDPHRLTMEDLPDDRYFGQGTEAGGDNQNAAISGLKELFYILKAVEDIRTEGGAAGRASISARLEQQGIPMTEAQVRSRLKRLTEMGYVECCRGRLGAMVTPQGRKLLVP